MNSALDKIPVSVLIPAKNEERNIRACLESLKRADEIFVVDSQSSDRTVEIAESFDKDPDYGQVRVVQFYYNGHWPKKKNWSLENLPFRNEWVLIVDCDERITPELWDEIATAIGNPDYNGYYLNRKVIFLGKWIRYGGRYPDWNLRLFKHEKGHYENLGTEGVYQTGDNEVHEHVILEGEAGYLKNDMLHEDFRNIYEWLGRHNRYSNWEARVYYNILNDIRPPDTLPPNLFGDAVQRKRFLKQIWVRWVPFKPTIRFILHYFLQLGFLDGKAGYLYTRLLSQYEFQIGVKLYELRKFGGQMNPKKDTAVAIPQSDESTVSPSPINSRSS